MKILYYSWDIKEDKNYPKAIKKIGIDLEVTSDEKEVIEKIKDKKIDILIFDSINIINYKKLFQYKKEENKLIYLAITDFKDDFILEDALECGLNDYISNDLTISQFIAKLKSFIYLLTNEKKYKFDSILKVGDLELNTLTREAKRDNNIIYLTNKEYKLLELLMTNKNKIVTREEINEIIWQGESDKNIEGVYIAFLRRKIEKGFQSKIIKTVRNVGYMIKD